MNNGYNNSIGCPGVSHVKPYSAENLRDLPKSYAQAALLYESASKRRGGARGKIAHNTTIHAHARPHDGETVYRVRLHDTDIVTFEPDGSVVLDSGGWQTTTTRDRMNRCGFRVGMGGGVASVVHGSHEFPYVDGMKLKYRSDGTPGMAWYPSSRQPCGTLGDIRDRRRRVLARAKREEHAGVHELSVVPFYWPGRQGGYSHLHGNCPEVFAPDSGFGLKRKTRRKIARQVESIAGATQEQVFGVAPTAKVDS